MSRKRGELQLQVVDKETGKAKKVVEIERKPNSKRNRSREKEYDGLDGLEHETEELQMPAPTRVAGGGGSGNPQ